MKIFKKDKENIIILIIGVLFFLLFFYRNFYGFAWNDEPFYISNANRLYGGDILFKNEWHKVQISAILLLPLVALYRGVMGTTEGILLCFRQGYLVFSAVVAIYTYFIIAKKKGKWCALAVTLMYFSYAKLSVATFSYNTISEAFFLIFLLQMVRFFDIDTYGLTPMIRAGITYSIIVVANPYFVIGFALLVFILVWNIKKDKKDIDICKNALKGLIIGVFSSIFIVSVFFFRSDTIPNLFENFSSIMKVGGDYGIPFVRRILQMFNAVVKIYWITIVPYLGIIIYIIVTKIRQKNFSEKAVCFIKSANVFMLLINIFAGMQDRKYCGVSFVALGMFGVIFAFLNNKKYKKEIIHWIFPGIVASVLFYFASDTGLVSTAAGCLYIAMAATMIFFEEIKITSFKEMLRNKWMIGSAIGIILVILSTAYLRVVHVFRDARLPQLDTEITVGPAKGLYTLAENAYEYTEIYMLIQENITSEDTVLFSKMLPWGYLSTDAKCGSYTTWQVAIADEELETYYALNPEKIPNIIMWVNEDFGYHNDKNPLEGYVYEEIIQKQNYEKTVFECATIFKKK